MSVLRSCSVSSCELSIHHNHKHVKAQNILLDAFYDVQLQVISRCLHSSADRSNPSKVLILSHTTEVLLSLSVSVPEPGCSATIKGSITYTFK